MAMGETSGHIHWDVTGVRLGRTSDSVIGRGVPLEL
jgi:hypothetical protein